MLSGEKPPRKKRGWVDGGCPGKEEGARREKQQMLGARVRLGPTGLVTWQVWNYSRPAVVSAVLQLWPWVSSVRCGWRGIAPGRWVPLRASGHSLCHFVAPACRRDMAWLARARVSAVSPRGPGQLQTGVTSAGCPLLAVDVQELHR